MAEVHENRTNTQNPGKSTISNQSGAKSGAVDAQNASRDTDFTDWLNGCPVELTDEAKTGILTIVRGTEEQ